MINNVDFELETSGGAGIDYIQLEKPNLLMKFSALVDFMPSEYTKIRLQYNYDATRFESNWNSTTGFLSTTHTGIVNHEVFLSFTMAVGLKGAYSL